MKTIHYVFIGGAVLIGLGQVNKALNPELFDGVPDAPAKKVEKVFSQRDKDVFAAAVIYEQALNEAAALPRSQISVSFHRTCDDTGQTLYDAASDKGLKSTIWRVWDRCADFK